MQRLFGLGRLLGFSIFQGSNSKRTGKSKLWVTVTAFGFAIFFGVLFPARSIAVDSQEILEQRTEYTKTFKNSDGTITLDFSGEPLHYLDGTGAWQDIDTTIVTSTSASTQTGLLASSTLYPQYSVTKNSYKAFFGETLADPIRMEWKDKSVEFYPLNYATPSISVEKKPLFQ